MDRIIHTVLLAIILSGLGFYFFSVIPSGKRLHNELAELQSDYDSLLLAKQKTIVRYDTIIDTLIQKEFIPRLILSIWRRSIRLTGITKQWPTPIYPLTTLYLPLGS